MPPCLAVIVPCYNEAGTIEEILRRILARSEVAEVVVVDDGSTDDSWQRLQTWSGRDPRLRLLRHPHNRGKGAAIQTALPHLRAPFVLIQDADLEYDPADYPRLLQPLLEGRAEAVYGTRFGPGARARTPLWHRGGNWLLTRIARGLTGLPLTDEATGYKVFRRELLQSLNLQERGFGFCPEVTAKLARLGARVVEVPIHYQGRSRAEGKKIRWRDGLEAVRCLWRYSRPRWSSESCRPQPPGPDASAEESTSAGQARRLPGWVWVLPALAYGWGLVWATGLVPEWGRWYSASPYYRQQVAAMLRGDLALSRDPADLRGGSLLVRGRGASGLGLGRAVVAVAVRTAGPGVRVRALSRHAGPGGGAGSNRVGGVIGSVGVRTALGTERRQSCPTRDSAARASCLAGTQSGRCRSKREPDVARSDTSQPFGLCVPGPRWHRSHPSPFLPAVLEPVDHPFPGLGRSRNL
ncbi:MAG: glycosyltransferase family 2 protein [Limisphaera sp.]